MSIRYKYNNKIYATYQDLRTAIWDSEHKVFEYPQTTEEFAELGLNVTVEQYDPIDEMDVEDLRAVCLKRLNAQLMDYRNADDTAITSSLGFKANANITAYNNVDGVMLHSPRVRLPSWTTTTTFRCSTPNSSNN